MHIVTCSSMGVSNPGYGVYTIYDKEPLIAIVFITMAKNSGFVCVALSAALLFFSLLLLSSVSNAQGKTVL